MFTDLPAKNDSDEMFCLQSYQGQVWYLIVSIPDLYTLTYCVIGKSLVY